MATPPQRTHELLSRLHAGEEDALRELLERHEPWVRARVRERLGARLRQRAETDDFVQDAMVDALKYGPKFMVSSEDHFRGLLARIVENALRDRHQYFDAARRARDRERPLPSDSVLDLDPRSPDRATPSRAADRREREAWLRLGLELLRPEDREVILLRQEDALPFEEVGARLGVAPNAARMRFERALAKLGKVVTRLRAEGAASVAE